MIAKIIVRQEPNYIQLAEKHYGKIRDPKAHNKLLVDYIRHYCTNYDKVVDILHKRDQQQKRSTLKHRQSFTLLKTRFLDEISKHYPELKEECDRQIRCL